MTGRAAGRTGKFLGKVRRQKFYLLALIPLFGYLVLFKYYPMYGAVIAFKNFSFKKGILGSDWAGLKYFKMFLGSADLKMVMRNTLAMSALSIVFVTVFSIALAVLISDLRSLAFKKIAQTISYLPHFISWVVIAGMAMTLFSIDGGPVNGALQALGILKAPVNFLNAGNIWGTLTGLNVWKSIGWNSIIYIAAIASIDPQMYESAIIDGAGKLKQIFYITLPTIVPTIVILFIFSLGYILNAGFEQQFFLKNPVNYTRIETLDTYVFRYGIQKLMYSYGAAVGIMKSAVGFALVVLTNMFTRKFFKMGIF
ncbi:MAG: ABC transporter permease subunit [Firmicutes bacterium]|nr:ABC transporter permease subunit [Bacillota bacterium]